MRWLLVLRGLARAEFPDDLAEHAEPDDGVARRKVQAADEAADTLLGIGDAAQIEEAALVERVYEHGGDAFGFGCGSEREFFGLVWNSRFTD